MCSTRFAMKSEMKNEMNNHSESDSYLYQPVMPNLEHVRINQLFNKQNKATSHREYVFRLLLCEVEKLQFIKLLLLKNQRSIHLWHD